MAASFDAGGLPEFGDARSCPASSGKRRVTPSTTTKSLPRPCIFANRISIAAIIANPFVNKASQMKSLMYQAQPAGAKRGSHRALNELIFAPLCLKRKLPQANVV